MGSPMTVGEHGRWVPTGVHCACGECYRAECYGGESIPYDVGVVQGKGVFPVLNINSGEVEYIDWLDDSGAPYLNVVYLCSPADTELEEYMATNFDEYLFECFTLLVEDIQEAQDEEDPMHHESELLMCDACYSSVVTAEPVILLTHGMLTVPARRPPGSMPVKFEADHRQHEHVLCLRCAKMANMLRDPPVWGGRLYEMETG